MGNRRPERPPVDRGLGWAGSEFEVTVGPVAHGGHCVARHEGRVVFVRHSLPGERVVVRVTEDRHPGFCRADAVEVLEASPDRVDRPCPASGPGRCGGCDWQHVAPAAQRELKAAVVREQLTRLAGQAVPDEDHAALVPSDAVAAVGDGTHGDVELGADPSQAPLQVPAAS